MTLFVIFFRAFYMSLRRSICFPASCSYWSEERNEVREKYHPTPTFSSQSRKMGERKRLIHWFYFLILLLFLYDFPSLRFLHTRELFVISQIPIICPIYNFNTWLTWSSLKPRIFAKEKLNKKIRKCPTHLLRSTPTIPPLHPRHRACLHRRCWRFLLRPKIRSIRSRIRSTGRRTPQSRQASPKSHPDNHLPINVSYLRPPSTSARPECSSNNTSVHLYHRRRHIRGNPRLTPRPGWSPPPAASRPHPCLPTTAWPQLRPRCCCPPPLTVPAARAVTTAAHARLSFQSMSWVYLFAGRRPPCPRPWKSSGAGISFWSMSRMMKYPRSVVIQPRTSMALTITMIKVTRIAAPLAQLTINMKNSSPCIWIWLPRTTGLPSPQFQGRKNESFRKIFTGRAWRVETFCQLASRF